MRLENRLATTARWQNTARRPGHSDDLSLGGWGAASDFDGQNGQFCAGNGETYNLPVELTEARYGVVVERYAFDDEPNSNLLDVYIAQLRRKLESDGEPRLIHTRRGVGYMLEEAS